MRFPQSIGIDYCRLTGPASACLCQLVMPLRLLLCCALLCPLHNDGLHLLLLLLLLLRRIYGVNMSASSTIPDIATPTTATIASSAQSSPASAAFKVVCAWPISSNYGAGSRVSNPTPHLPVKMRSRPANN